MPRLVVRTAAVFGLLSAMSAQAKILPDNELYLEDNFDRASAVTEADFNSIIDRARTLYTDVVRKNGGKLDIRGHWNDSTVNANATQFFGTWTVNMYGGLARRPEITPDGFALVLCHEIGHHLAGFPFASSWAANEGQADYFASNHCAQLFWGEQKDLNAAAATTVNAVAKAKCDESWQNEDAQNLCYRTMNAGESLAQLLAALKRKTVDFNTPDKKEVRSTDHSHPDAQCRLDTYVAGAVCTSDYDAEIIPGKSGGRGRNNRTAEEAAATFSCTARDNYTSGLRPRCWFKPSL